METANKIHLVSDRVERAKSFLLSQFKDKANINLIVEALVEEVQEAENALIELRDLRMLETATGATLDNIGKRMKVVRSSDDDTVYRTAIKVRILRKINKGTASDIKSVFKLLTQDPDPIISNTSPYVVELAAVLTCIGESDSAINEIISLFPVNTGVRVLSKPARPFGFAGNPKAFPLSSGNFDPPQGQLCSIVADTFGIARDPRFKRTTDYIPPNKNPPIPTILPYITYTGDLVVGSVLTANIGVWSGVEPISYLYQWYVDNLAVDGEVNQTYTVLAGQEGKPIYCRVTADNIDGQYIVNTNTVVVPIVVDTGIVKNLGIPNNTYSASGSYFGPLPPPSPVYAAVSVQFKTDGTLTISETFGGTYNINYLTTTGSGSAADYEIFVTKVNGDNLTSPAQIDIWQALTSDRTFSLSISQVLYGYQFRSGTFTFTVRRKSTGVTEQKTITLYVDATVESDL